VSVFTMWEEKTINCRIFFYPFKNNIIFKISIGSNFNNNVFYKLNRNLKIHKILRRETQ
jgi:hypothetical protein